MWSSNSPQALLKTFAQLLARGTLPMSFFILNKMCY